MVTKGRGKKITKPSVNKEPEPKTARQVYIRKTGLSDEDPSARSLMARAAHLFYQEGWSQIQIGKELGVSQVTVSRLLVEARKQHIVNVEIKSLYRFDLEKRLLNALEPHSLKQIRVVQRGEGADRDRNIYRLGLAGAEVAVECLAKKLLSPDVAITLSCGETLQALVKRMIANLRRLDETEQAERTFKCYPFTLHADYHLKSIYPTSLVTELSAVRGLRSIRTEGYATSLPDGFYARDREAREGYLKEGRVRELIVEKASGADMFLLGIGTANTYQDYVSSLKVNDKMRDKYLEGAEKCVAEVGFVGIDKSGKWHTDIGDLCVGVATKVLKGAATSYPKRYVIAVAGGESKREAVAAAMRTNCFNTLVTDESVAEYLLERF